MLNAIKDGNVVKIEGIVSEIDLKPGKLNKNGSEQNAISGSITVRVDQTLPSGEEQTLEVPVYMYSTEFTNAGKKNPAYESIERIMNEYISIASGGIEKATKVRITRGEISMNEYYKGDKLVSFPRIRASFVNEVKGADFHPQATFSAIFTVLDSKFATDADGVENPNRYEIKGALPKWGGKVDVVPFIAQSEGVISAVSQYWQKGDTVKANGRLNFTSSTQTVKTEVDFGEAVDQARTITISDLVITGGSQTPLEDDMSYDAKDIKDALATRLADLEALKEKAAQKSATATKAKANDFSDLGF